jgi:hypothetical protein
MFAALALGARRSARASRGDAEEVDYDRRVGLLPHAEVRRGEPTSRLPSTGSIEIPGRENRDDFLPRRTRRNAEELKAHSIRTISSASSARAIHRERCIAACSSASSALKTSK